MHVNRILMCKYRGMEVPKLEERQHIPGNRRFVKLHKLISVRLRCRTRDVCALAVKAGTHDPKNDRIYTAETANEIRIGQL